MTGAPAFLVQGRAVARADFLAEVAARAAEFRQQGVRGGDCMAIALPNGTAAAAGIAACMQEGLRCLLLDPALKPAEVESYCARARAVALLRGNSLAPLPRAAAPPATPPSVEPGGFLLLSSGTSGPPKLVLRTPAQVDAALRVFRSRLPLEEQDRVAGVLPFFHSFGLLFVLLSSLRHGAAICIDDASPRTFARAVARDRVTVLPATPFLFRLMSETRFSNPPDFSSIRLAISAGAALPAALAEAFHAAFGVGLAQSYGTTESGPAALGLPGERVASPGWVGRPYGGVVIHADARAGGGHAPIVVDSPGCAAGYLDATDDTTRVFTRAGVVTGDLGYLDERGQVFVIGRQRPLITVAGKKVAPAEVEACLRTHPFVSEVIVSEATGEHGPQVRATVTVRGPVTALALRQHCAVHLADHKIPREFVFVDALAAGPMGKARLNGGAPPS